MENKLKKIFGCTLLLLFNYCVLIAQPNITRVEWYLNNDPGYGNATPLSLTPSANLLNLSINIDVQPLQQGVHVVGIRSLDANGAWSLDNKWVFLKPYPNVGATPQPNINRVEWYLDNDPGFGNATPISIVPATELSSLNIPIDLVPLQQGVHIVGVRSRDANGAWSHDNKWVFLKPYTNIGAIPQPNITRVEWYMDNDPGYGNATPISIVASPDIAGLIIPIDVAAASQGVHIVGIRSQDANGAWSLDNKWIFLKPYTDVSGSPQPQIVRMEYFIDTDPGYGNATPVTITAATDISQLIFDADISTVVNGSHKLGIRTLDANGTWSLDNEVAFTGGTLLSITYQWTGNVSNAWNNPANWSQNIVPTINTHVVIPANRPFNPTVPNAVIAECKTILIHPNASVTVATGAQLKVQE